MEKIAKYSTLMGLDEDDFIRIKTLTLNELRISPRHNQKTDRFLNRGKGLLILI
jgi:hypothetical protein